MDQIYTKYASMVYGYLMRLCKDPDLAEELLQETFYQAIRSANRYDESCSISTWLCSIANNLWKKELTKRSKRSLLSSEEFTETMETGSEEPSAEDAFLKQTEAVDAMKQIHSLPELEKEVVLLRAMGGLSFREIGEVVGRTENWARVTFFRAKKKLRR